MESKAVINPNVFCIAVFGRSNTCIYISNFSPSGVIWPKIYDGSMSNHSETQYVVKTFFCLGISIVKPIILILAPKTYDKWTHIECLAVNDNKLKSFPHSFSQTTLIRMFLSMYSGVDGPQLRFCVSMSLVSRPLQDHRPFYLFILELNFSYQVKA